jgi:hypothetical protein
MFLEFRLKMMIICINSIGWNQEISCVLIYLMFVEMINVWVYVFIFFVYDYLIEFIL